MQALERSGVVLEDVCHPSRRINGMETPEIASCPHLNVSWDALIWAIDELILKVHGAEPRPTIVVGLSFRGFLIARGISKVLKIPAAYAAAESFGYDRADFHGHVDAHLDGRVFRMEMLQTHKDADYSHVLIVDDHPGRTMRHAEQWIRSGHAFGGKPQSVQTAVIWNYEGARVIPTISLDEISPVCLLDSGRQMIPRIQLPEQILWPRGCLPEVRKRVAASPLPSLIWPDRNIPLHAWIGATLRSAGGIPQIILSWDLYARIIDHFIVSVADHLDASNQFIGLAFGGFLPAYAASKAISNDDHESPYAFIGAERYEMPADGGRETEGGEVVFARDMIRSRPGLGTRIVLMDELGDTGESLQRSEAWLRSSPWGFGIKDIQTAVLLLKAGCRVAPAVSVVRVPLVDGKPPWLVLPWEEYYDGNVSITDVAMRVADRY